MLTPKSAKRTVYADMFTDFRITALNNDVARAVNEDAVKTSIKNLLMTNRGERLMQPNIGSDIQKMLFENVSPTTMLVLKDYIEDTLSQYEPRANLIDIEVVGRPDNNAVNITVVFSVVNNERPSKVDVIIDRVR